MKSDDHKPGWYFWQIDGWLGKWSLRHWFDNEGVTACGRYPMPQVGSGGYTPSEYGKRCQVCERVLSQRTQRS